MADDTTSRGAARRLRREAAGFGSLTLGALNDTWAHQLDETRQQLRRNFSRRFRRAGPGLFPSPSHKLYSDLDRTALRRDLRQDLADAEQRAVSGARDEMHAAGTRAVDYRPPRKRPRLSRSHRSRLGDWLLAGGALCWLAIVAPPGYGWGTGSWSGLAPTIGVAVSLAVALGVGVLRVKRGPRQSRPTTFEVAADIADHVVAANESLTSVATCLPDSLTHLLPAVAAMRAESLQLLALADRVGRGSEPELALVEQSRQLACDADKLREHVDQWVRERERLDVALRASRVGGYENLLGPALARTGELTDNLAYQSGQAERIAATLNAQIGGAHS